MNANHVLVFADADVAGHYDEVFETSWQALQSNKSPSKAAAAAFFNTNLATEPFGSQPDFVPKMEITFSPHTPADVDQILGGISNRIMQETHSAKGNVLFAVMQLTGSQSPVYKTLGALHAEQSVYGYGISDAPYAREGYGGSGHRQAQPSHVAAAIRSGAEPAGTRDSRQIRRLRSQRQ